ncbi:glycosyl transferase family 1 [Pontibacillus halophilus JSM 076056 = DSM 19796]|uniref:Glycosyl transferase family 1 n=1 Tax=Pontibacillus halophilus JSM 076056 = DSM 19796 TaxID=1385510 RepID=A0A0A5I0B2_9BACI|nr:GT4 family glycosyltransferase PelF [Pontibacillus halophilus]KGX89292.1 glycosyl transferase family 1 [Pontibacillus halophilus JSM 076056 = DSM 19796]
MKIGILVEGSYPYVSGGVSSWVQTLIQRMPQHDFEIIAITPNDMSETDYRYTLPSNVSGVTTLPLLTQEAKGRKKIHFTEAEQRQLTSWFMLEDIPDHALRIMKEKITQPERFFSSKLFWQLLQDSYEKEEQSSSFIDYFWMWRGMYSPVLELMQRDVPKVDLIHAASTGYAGLLAARMKQEQQIPFIITEHGIYSREREEEILQANWIPDYYKERWIAFFHHLSKQAYCEADDIITLFDRNGEHQLEIGAPQNKQRIIPNGIHYEALSQLEHQSPKENVLRIGAIVRVVPIKDIKTMINAAKLLHDDGVPFELTIMGPLDEDDEYAEECQQMIEQYGLMNEVSLIGRVNISNYLPHFDIGLLTSISEGQPLALLEGMAAGLPFIATDVGACSELIEGRDDDPFGPAGFLVSPVDSMQVANYCKWFYKHPEETRQLGLNGQRRTETYYQIHQVIEAYDALYEERRNYNGRDWI